MFVNGLIVEGVRSQNHEFVTLLNLYIVDMMRTLIYCYYKYIVDVGPPIDEAEPSQEG